MCQQFFVIIWATVFMYDNNQFCWNSFLLHTYLVHLTQRTWFLLLCLFKRFQGFKIIFIIYVYQQKFSYRYFCFVSILKIIQIFWSNKFARSVPKVSHFCIKYVYVFFLKNISKSVTKYTTNERCWTVPSSLEIFLIRSYLGFFYILKMCCLWKKN